MSIYGPQSAFLLVGGRDISGDTYQYEEMVEQIMEEKHGLGDAWEESVPVGLGRITLSASGGLYDDRTLGIMDALQSKGATRQLVSFGAAGYSAGAESTLIDGTYAARFKRIAANAGLTKAHAEHVLTGTYYRGRVIHGLTAETASTGNSQSTSVDSTTAKPQPITNATVANPTVVTAPRHGLTSGDTISISGSSTTPTIDGSRVVTVTDADTFTVPVNVTSGGGAQTATYTQVTKTGGVVDLHVPALTLGGWTSVTIILRDSADNVTFANVTGGTFTNVTAGGASERLTITGQVRRYRAMQWTFNGAGSGQSITPYVALWT
jgi:hypothetical protein